MLDLLRQFFFTAAAPLDATAPPEGDAETRLATAALMVNIANADGTFSPAERQMIVRLLETRFGLDASTVGDLVARAEVEEKGAVDIFTFTHALKRRLDPKARLEVVEMLWDMAFADGALHEFEDNIVSRVADLLGVSSESRVALKREVEAQVPLTGKAS